MIIHNLVQGSDEWLAFRLTHHGASEAAAMLGLSKKTSRSELLYMKHTATPKQFSEWVQRNVLDYGHEVEDMARPLVEDLIGEDLYPVTGSIDGTNISASCDGLTMLYDTVFEHKQWNEALAASVDAGILLEEHMPQCQQELMVTEAERVIFTVSDGTPNRFVHMEVLPDPAWFERLKAGWAQFDRDLADYKIPEAVQQPIAEPVQALPAVSVQVTGQIDVRENFAVFEKALREFLDTKLIRDPQTDQDFADLDLQIKAMKKAEETLDAAEAMMLAQIQSVDEAKRQKDMLANLVRENRLMAEKLLASEKERRRAEKIVAAREAFTRHLAGLQSEIRGVRMDVAMPDFAAAIKGLRTLTSIQDKLDTALANGKIAADSLAADLRTKLNWIDGNAAEYRFLLSDLQHLVAKPLEDFKLAITVRIDAHKKAERERIEAERERIRVEEEARAQREAQAVIQKAEDERQAHEQKEADAKRQVFGSRQPQNNQFPPVVSAAVEAVRHVEPTVAQADEPATLPLGEINTRLSPISLTAAGLAELGIEHSATHKTSKLYRESDFPRICAALVQHIEQALQTEAA